MKLQELNKTAMKLVADDKGILAMDESFSTCKNRAARRGEYTELIKII